MADLYKDIEKKTDETGILVRVNSAARQFSASSTCPAPLSCSKTGSTAMLSCVPTPPPPIWLLDEPGRCSVRGVRALYPCGSGVQLPQREWRAGVRNERCGRRAGNLARYLGALAAAVKGSKIDLVDKFADTIRREWNGLRPAQRLYVHGRRCDRPALAAYLRYFWRGSDPDQRDYGPYYPPYSGQRPWCDRGWRCGNDQTLPGRRRARNALDPHYAAGQWNVYATPGSRKPTTCHRLPAAVKAWETSSIMPYYSKPQQQKSAVQHDLAGNTVEMKPYGFCLQQVFY